MGVRVPPLELLDTGVLVDLLEKFRKLLVITGMKRTLEILDHFLKHPLGGLGLRKSLLLLLSLLLLGLLLLLTSLLLFLGQFGDNDRKVVLDMVKRRALGVVNCSGDTAEDAGEFSRVHTLCAV